MSGPWEKYAKPENAAPVISDGPWTKYAKPKESSLAEQAETAGRSLLEGATAGLSEPVLSGVNAVVGNTIDSGFDAKDFGDFASKAVDWDRIKHAYAADVERRKRLESENPKVAIGSELVGAVLPSPINIGGKIMKGADAAIDAVKWLGKGEGLMSAAARGAASGALGAAGTEAFKQAAERPSGFIDSDSAMGDIANAAKWGGGIGGTVAGAFALPGAVKASAKKMLSSKTGVSERTIDDYLARSQEINAAPSMEKIHDDIYEAVKKLSDDVDAKAITREQANQAYVDLRNEIALNLKQQKYDAKDAVREAQRILEASVARAQQETAGDIVRGIDSLKGQVQAGSKAAREAIPSDAKIDLAQTYQELDNTIDKLRAYGTPEHDSIANQIQAYKAKLMNENWANIGGQEAKTRLQGLDQLTDYSPMAGTFDKAKNAAYKGIRSTLDESLKDTVDPYRQAMGKVAEDTDLLGQMSSEFGTEPKAIQSLGGLDRTASLPKKQLLEQFGQRTGKDYISAVTPEKMPEFGALTQAKTAAEEMAQPGWEQQRIQELLDRSKEARGLQQADANLSSAQGALAPFGSIAPNSAGMTSIQNKIKSVMSDGSIENRRMLGELSKMTGQDFVQAIDNLRVKEAFMKGDRAGSSNVNFWGALFGAAGAGLLGVTGGLGGIGAGVAAGKLMDRFGPQVAKSVLDQVIRIRGIPTIEKISQMSIPPEAKEELAKDLKLWFMDKHIQSDVPPRRIAQDEREKNRMPAQKPRTPEPQAQQMFLQGN